MNTIVRYSTTVICLLALLAAVAGARPACAEIRNVIIVIGDGMGPQQLGLLFNYHRFSTNNVLRKEVLATEQIAQNGVARVILTDPAGAMVTDSAASGTQMASGVPALPRVVGIDEQGADAETILEQAKQMGKSAGLVSDARITHATPAVFAAHEVCRDDENDIACDMLEADVDVMLSGGLRHWIPAAVTNVESDIHAGIRARVGEKFEIKTKREDDRNLLDEAEQRGYSLAFTKQQLDAADGKMLGLFSQSGMPDGIAEFRAKGDPERTVPTLREMTEKALAILERNPTGFFLMVEAAQIDWAGHYNDTGMMLYELLRFEDALDAVYNWARTREDTLVLVTADHETGGFAFNYANYQRDESVPFPGTTYTNRMYESPYTYAKPGLVDRIAAQKMSFGSILEMFEDLDEEEQTPEKLMDIFNANSDFPITLEEARSLFVEVPNPYYIPGDDDRGFITLPQIHDFSEFYPGEPFDRRMNLLGRAVGPEQYTSWATGTHTHTPVLLFAMGPSEILARYPTIMHMTDFGRITKAALTGK